VPATTPTQALTPTSDPIIQSLTEAFDFIESSKPAYSFAFDRAGSWNFNFPENAKVSNGELIVTNGPRNRPEDPTDHWNAAQIRLFTSHALAVSFNFQIEGEGGQFTHCSFETFDFKSNGNIAFRNMYLFMPGGKVNLEQTNDNRTFYAVEQASSNYNFSQTNLATVILLNNNSAVYINGEMVLAYKDPKAVVDFEEIGLSANGTSPGLTCHFDNLKTWDLSPILESNK
jgi:hypothetical protein